MLRTVSGAFYLIGRQPLEWLNFEASCGLTLTHLGFVLFLYFGLILSPPVLHDTPVPLLAKTVAVIFALGIGLWHRLEA